MHFSSSLLRVYISFCFIQFSLSVCTVSFLFFYRFRTFYVFCWLNSVFFVSSNLKILFTQTSDSSNWSENFHSHWSSPMIPSCCFRWSSWGFFAVVKNCDKLNLGDWVTAASATTCCYHTTLWGGGAGGESILCFLFGGRKFFSVSFTIICVLVYLTRRYHTFYSSFDTMYDRIGLAYGSTGANRINRHCSCLTILQFHIIFHSFLSDDILQQFDQFSWFFHFVFHVFWSSASFRSLSYVCLVLFIFYAQLMKQDDLCRFDVFICHFWEHVCWVTHTLDIVVYLVLV